MFFYKYIDKIYFLCYITTIKHIIYISLVMKENTYIPIQTESIEEDVIKKNWLSALYAENYTEFIRCIRIHYPTEEALLQEFPNILLSANEIICNKSFRTDPLKEAPSVFLRHRIHFLLHPFSDAGLKKAKEIFLDLYKSQDFNKQDWEKTHDFLVYR